ncbi:hypothetical protein M0R19_01145 [Candidatus Pacearchaeota archaeon]|jgi:hypothetical protein|nr:hypothetical protein [Candidatus Pacearchaeota archaeon]
MTKGFVLKDWIGELSWKQQSVLFSSLRGPDNIRPPFTKKLNRWIRRVTQNNADLSTEYMEKVELPTVKELCSELEYTTVHYFCHLIHAMEIIGYKHPDKEVKEIANNYYSGLVNALHLNPETIEQMDKRLEDKF